MLSNTLITLLNTLDPKKTIHSLVIPDWDKVLELAIKAADATGLGFMRADIVLQPSLKTPGKTLPKILELNAQPGLKIQLCNKAGLKRRLERVEDLEVDSPEKGIRIAKELFGARELAHLYQKPIPINIFETVEVESSTGEKIKVKAKIDTGAFRTSIDANLAKKMGILRDDNILFQKEFWSSLGKTTRPVIGITLFLAGKRIETSASISDRSDVKQLMLIGRRDLSGFNIEVK